jgi:hypothetical protein
MIWLCTFIQLHHDKHLTISPLLDPCFTMSLHQPHHIYTHVFVMWLVLGIITNYQHQTWDFQSGLSLVWQWLGMASHYWSSAWPAADRAPRLLLPHHCSTAAAADPLFYMCVSQSRLLLVFLSVSRGIHKRTDTPL